MKAGDLLIAMTGATIGKFAMVPYSSEVLLVNQRVGKFFLGNNPVEKLPFIYCTLKQPEVYGEVVNRGQGSAQPNISASLLIVIVLNVEASVLFFPVLFLWLIIFLLFFGRNITMLPSSTLSRSVCITFACAAL